MRLDGLTSVWLFGEHDFPIVEINNHHQIEPDALPVSPATQELIANWLCSARFESAASPAAVLLAGVLAATAIAADLAASIRVNLSMRLPGPDDETLGN